MEEVGESGRGVEMFGCCGFIVGSGEGGIRVSIRPR